MVTANLRSLLLICGVVASLLYVSTDLLASALWQGYSFTNQAVSELSGVGAPTRSLVVPLYLVYDVLTIAFGLGVLGYSRKRGLRFIGILMVIIGAAGFVGTPFPLQLGITEATFTNTMHSIIAGAQGLLYVLAMGVGAFTFRNRFRFFSIGLLLALIVVGAVMSLMAGVDITQHGFTAPPQWFGLIERIDIYGSTLWVAVLAIVLLTAEKSSGLIGGGDVR